MENLIKIKEYRLKNFIEITNWGLRSYYTSEIAHELNPKNIISTVIFDNSEAVLETVRVGTTHLYVEFIPRNTISSLKEIKVRVIYTVN
ncbi:hypothetical protein [Fusobacterium massiliense]|uniref:hypothetical protein n=1 Tax=Fusobacterium massiliense TaxID=1852365 RepID=UPI0028D4ED26|nr:hypothetical protein [Fusobacterium massiliense]